MDPSPSPTPFGYQTRLLNRTSSTKGLTRTNSGRSNALAQSPTVETKWAPSHRVATSLDAVRGKWEERVRAAEAEEAAMSGRPSSPSSVRAPHSTPIALKRQTMPAPITASPLSPNSTGVTVEFEQTSSRIHVPSLFPTSSSSAIDRVLSTLDNTSRYTPSPPTRWRRSNTVESVSRDMTGSSSGSDASSSTAPRTPSSQSFSTPSPQRRPTAMSSPSYDSSPSTPTRTRASSLHSSGSSATTPSPTKPVERSVPSVMSPTPYRSSYMASKKAGTYGESLTAGRRLGRHLPRIASGDAGDDWKADEPTPKEPPPPAQSRREARVRRLQPERTPSEPDVSGVVGVPGRIPLTRSRTAKLSATPLPSAKLASRTRTGMWADRDRALLQAHEYLCHVGEAQQWIEGCLEEELECGIVEMEDALRNGVILARLARVFLGENVVRRIYEAPKLDFRHSDNINIFFNFVRQVGLPECFIFELTDLYEKKNLPKVIYCIHALSHLLARRGLAQRIGNLLGHLEFSDDQLQKTQKGLKDAGVPMPNFSNVGRELAKEINEEPEVEVETEDERRDRLLMENEDSIVALQSVARGCLIRREHAASKLRIHLIERHVPKIQAQCRGLLFRLRMSAYRRQQDSLIPWATRIQAACRAFASRKRWRARLRRIKSISPTVVGIQAHIRGLLVRRRYRLLKTALKKHQPVVLKLQSMMRAQIVRKQQQAQLSKLSHPNVERPIIQLQAVARGLLKRRQVARHWKLIRSHKKIFIALQAQCRGVLTRRRMRAQMAKLEDVSHTVVRVQATVRTYLARKRLLMLIRALRKATPMLIGLQAKARANLARQQHRNMAKALSQVKVIKSVNVFQARARAAIARNRHREQTRQLEFVEPDVVGIQATCRGVLVRQDYYAWRDHLHRHYPVATILQAMIRGAIFRQTFRRKLQYYHDNLSKVVKIQSLFRAKETREQYRQLTMGTNVSVDTIKNFVHLLDDSEADFQEEIKVERLRKRVVEGIRENQALEHDVSELDVKIALVVQNAKTFEDLVKSRRRIGADIAASNAARASLLAAHGDPFAGPSTLDHAAKRKLELYQQLFYLLQTHGEYLSRLFVQMSLEDSQEKNRRLTERVVLTLFGYGQDRREDYLLLKLFQMAIHEEVLAASSIEDIVRGHPMFINVAVQYIRPRQIVYVREAFQTIIRAVLQEETLDLEANPTIIHRLRVEREELQTGTPSIESKDVTFRQALEIPETRLEYIHHMQTLQAWTEAFVDAILQSTRKMPFSMRYLARETLLSLRGKFPDATPEEYAACIARLVYYRYINPAIVTPETFDIVSSTIDIASRKNLAQISRVLTQITSGQEFGDDNPSYLPINDFVNKAIYDLTYWMLEVADVPDAETQLHAHEFLDATLQPKPIYITPNEIYGMHALLSQHLEQLAPTSNDTLRIILQELNGVPHFGSDELRDARDTAITLDLTNRFAAVQDPMAEEKALWVQAKRGVLAILRVQPAKNLWESLTAQVVDEHEDRWQEVLDNEMANEQQRHPSRMPSTTGADSAYRLEDIQSLTFKEVKLHTINFLLELEKRGKVSRSDGFQDILNAIAGDVRSKHRKRVRRQQEMESMKEALKHLAERKKYFEEQLNSYNNYVEAAMATMQRGKGKKRFVLPFTKQYFHDRDLKRSGQAPKHGSYIYSAKELYDKRILLSIDQYSPRQFDKMNFTISSDTPGVFNVLLESNLLGVTSRVAAEDVHMGDLLQAKFEDHASVSLYHGMVKMNLEQFIAHINKKFYV